MQYLSQRHICEIVGSTHDPATEYLENEVLDIFNNNNLEKYAETTDPKLMTWIATYYTHVVNNENKSTEFLKKAVGLGDQNAMNNLGCYYFEKGYLQTAKKMWLMCDTQNTLVQKNLKTLEMLEQIIEQESKK